MKFEFGYDELDAVAITVEVEEENYFKWLTVMFNNVRVNKEMLKIKNYSDNQVTVTFLKEYENEGKEWLQGFGRITNVEDVLFINIITYDNEREEEDSKGRDIDYGVEVTW